MKYFYSKSTGTIHFKPENKEERLLLKELDGKKVFISHNVGSVITW